MASAKEAAGGQPRQISPTPRKVRIGLTQKMWKKNRRQTRKKKSSLRSSPDQDATSWYWTFGRNFVAGRCDCLCTGSLHSSGQRGQRLGWNSQRVRIFKFPVFPMPMPSPRLVFGDSCTASMRDQSAALGSHPQRPKKALEYSTKFSEIHSCLFALLPVFQHSLGLVVAYHQSCAYGEHHFKVVTEAG